LYTGLFSRPLAVIATYRKIRRARLWLAVFQ